MAKAAATSSRKRKGVAAAKPSQTQSKSSPRAGRLPPKPIELYHWHTERLHRRLGLHRLGARRCPHTGQNLDDLPHLKNWVERLRARPAVQRGLALGRELRQAQASDPKAQEDARKILFGQRARSTAG